MPHGALTIDREDAITAIKLWGLATRRYYPFNTPLRDDAPEPVELYAGFELTGDPSEILRALAEEILALAEEWDDRADPADRFTVLTAGEKAVARGVGSSRLCPRSMTL